MVNPFYSPVPADTEYRARSIFNPCHPYLILSTYIGDIVNGLDCSRFSYITDATGNGSCLLLFITAFQYEERLSNMQAAEAVRSRIDWKYALHLPMTYGKVTPNSLCEFRSYLWADSTGRALLQEVLNRLTVRGFLSPIEGEAPAVGEVLRTICLVDRLYGVAQAMKIALESVAARQPDWLRGHIQPHWISRYSSRHLVIPDSEVGRERFAQTTGQDIAYLLAAIASADVPGLAHLPEVELLKAVWTQHFDAAQTSCTTADVDFRWRARCARCP